MKIEIERREYVRQTRVYSCVFDNEDLEIVNKKIKENFTNPITITAEEFAKACNLDNSFERAYYMLEYKPETLWHHTTFSLYGFLREYIDDVLWGVDCDVENCETEDYYDTIFRNEN